MSYSRWGARIDWVNGRRDRGYRRQPAATNAPVPDDYATPEEFEYAKQNWEDVPGRETVESPWYVFWNYGLGLYDAESLKAIRDENRWTEIRGYADAAAPGRAQLRLIVEEFLIEASDRKQDARLEIIPARYQRADALFELADENAAETR